MKAIVVAGDGRLLRRRDHLDSIRGRPWRRRPPDVIDDTRSSKLEAEGRQSGRPRCRTRMKYP